MCYISLCWREGDQGESLDRRKCSTDLISLFDQSVEQFGFHNWDLRRAESAVGAFAILS